VKIDYTSKNKWQQFFSFHSIKVSSEELVSLKEDNAKLHKQLSEQKQAAQAHEKALFELRSSMEITIAAWSSEKRNQQQEVTKSKQEVHEAYKV